MNQNKVLLSNSVIREIFKEHTSPVGNEIYNSPKLMKVEQKMFDQEYKLRNTFTDEQKELYSVWETHYCENQAMRETELFVYAFKLGARMMQEIMADPLKKD